MLLFCAGIWRSRAATSHVKQGCAEHSSWVHVNRLRSDKAACTVAAQYAAVNGWILGNSNGKYQTTYNGTLNSTGAAITKQPTLFGTDLQCAPALVVNLVDTIGKPAPTLCSDVSATLWALVITT